MALVNISGEVSGNSDAIFIDETAHVRQINILKRAKINGNIRSQWYAYPNRKKSGGTEFYAAHGNLSLLPGRLQFDNQDLFFKNMASTEEMLSHLDTKINLGVKPVPSETSYVSYEVEPDKTSNIVILGDVNGDSIELYSLGGHTHISGSVKVKSLSINNSSVNFSFASESQVSSVSQLTLDRGGQLNMSNGQHDILIIKDSAKISKDGVICLDTDPQGNLIDEIVMDGKLDAFDGVFNFEPGITYNDVKRFSSDPKALQLYIANFEKNVNAKLAEYGLTTRAPKHIWYTQGEMGRQLACSSHGCHIGDFVNSYAKSIEPLPLWRYILSFVGCIVLILITLVIIKKSGSGRFG